MLNVYKATSVERIIESSLGHTKPWVVVVETNNSLKKYVVKLYTTDQIENNNSLSSEVFCNVLANEFDLNVPEMALIDFSGIENSLAPIYSKQYFNVDNRLKFGTIEINPSQTFKTGIDFKTINSYIEIGSLYAFDNLIRNADRGNSKPNLLLSDNSAFLIDHEYALQTKDISILDITKDDFILEDKYSKKHIFHNYLMKHKKNEIDSYFNSFIENLRNCDINKLYSYNNTLKDYEFKTNYLEITAWLSHVKNNFYKFETILKKSI